MNNIIEINNIKFEVIDSRQRFYCYYAILKNDEKYYFLKKICNDEFLFANQLNMEIEVLTKLKSNYVPKIKWFKENEYIIYEFISADNLKFMKNISVYDSLQIIYKLTFILEKLHNICYIHNDLKTGNIFVDKGKNVYLLDFGNSCKFGDTVSFLTPNVSSIEQILKEKLDNRSDIYSLGVLLHDLIDKKELFLLNDNKEEFIKTKKELIPYIESNIDYKKEINDIIFKSANPDINQRYNSVVDMRKDLENILNKYKK